jgi:two-component system LytT family sensor kinase
MKILAMAGFWTLVALWYAGQLYFTTAQSGWRHISWWEAFGSSLADWYTYAPLSVAVIWLGGRRPIERGKWTSRAALHFGASILFAFLYVLLRAGVAQAQTRLGAATIGFGDAAKVLLKTLPFSIGIYWLILSALHAFDYYRKFHERELRNSELETHLARAKLQALQMQLNPHFLFNTLHTISALMHSDVEAADRMVARLSDLLRSALDNTDDHEVTLRQELNFLRRYLEIEQTRFQERLAVQMEISPEVLDAQVPNLVLQPLVENAIRHGIEPHAKPGLIQLKAFRRNGTLEIQVQDNGGGLRPGNKREGIGLSNTRARLKQLYGDDQSLDLSNNPSGGTIARVTMPFQKEDPATNTTDENQNVDS